MAFFSERMGIEPTKALQLNTMDDDLKNGLWSTAYRYCLSPIYELGGEYNISSAWLDFSLNLWKDFFKKPIDEISKSYREDLLFRIKEFYFSTPYYKIYDFIEFLAKYMNDSSERPLNNLGRLFIKECNSVLELENSGYRFVERQLSPITNSLEIKSIEDALKIDEKNVYDHLETALKFLSDREHPQYRTSVTEAILAVESLSKKLTGKSTFPDALKILASEEALRSIQLDQELKKGLEKIYNWTSGDSGMRHGKGENSIPIEYEEAKFMVVFCSALINYLTYKAKKSPHENKALG